MENLALIAALTLVSIVSSATLFINWAVNKLVPGLLPIAIGLSITSVGILLLTTQGQLTGVISIVLANSLVLCGRIPMLVGLMNFWNQNSFRLIVSICVFCLVSIAGLFYFTTLNEDTLWRIRIYSTMMAIFDFSCVYIVLSGVRSERRLRPLAKLNPNLGAYALSTIFFFNGVIELVLMFLRGNAPLDSTNSSTSILLLGGILTVMVIAFAVIIMTMEELSVEHQENAVFDPITTILNYRTFLEVGQRVMGIALRYSKPVSLLTIELDSLDEITQKHGNKIAHQLLRHFSLMATDRRRNEDVLARTGVKEFRMLLPSVDEQGCLVVIEKIHKGIESQTLKFKGKTLPFTVTISAVTRREEDLDLGDMLQEGDIELYRIKQTA
ncbi:MAG: GGDEF domain-containing protein [Pseudohongiellaceae bacterium]